MKKTQTKYQISIFRCIIALLISTAIMSILAVQIVQEVVRLDDSVAYSVFVYFTTVSNIFAAYAAILTVPYALDGIFKRRYNVSTQITKLLFCGAVCVTVTMILALCLLWPINGDDAVTGYNFWCHIVCPILVLSLFAIVSREKPVRISDCIFSTIPFLLYECLYIIMVVVVGPEHGGWEDFYCILKAMPIGVAIPAITGAVFLIAFVFRAVHNSRAKVRREKMIEDIIRFYQPEDGTDLRFMLYEMGEFMGGYDGQYELTIPIQLLQILAEQYSDIQLDDMVKIYTKGALNYIKNK